MSLTTKMPEYQHLVCKLAIAIAMLTTACRSQQSDNNLESVGGIQISEIASEPTQGHVFIYYANETRPEGVERDNYYYITYLMRLIGLPYLQEAAERIERDMYVFPDVVDKEIDILKRNICDNRANQSLHLVVFDNNHARSGQFRFCKAGGTVPSDQPAGLAAVSSADLDSILALPEFKNDYRLKANPLAHKAVFKLALALVASKFAPDTHTYSLVSKSHGSSDKALGIRLQVRGELIRGNPAQEDLFKSSIRGIVEKKAEVVATLLRDQIVARGLRGDGEFSLEALKQGLLTNSYALKQKLLESSLLKESVTKDDLANATILKEDPLKATILKEDPLKASILKEDPLKTDILKNDLVGNESISNQQAIDQLGLPAIGVTKDDYYNTLAAASHPLTKIAMRFTSVFVESCYSAPNAAQVEVMKKSNNLGVVFASFGSGINSYTMVNYDDLFAKFQWRGAADQQLRVLIGSNVSQAPMRNRAD